jgi:hypothetical protein
MGYCSERKLLVGLHRSQSAVSMAGSFYVKTALRAFCPAN